MSVGADRHDVVLHDPTLVEALLQRACDEIDDVQHAVITSRDGLVVAANKESGGSGDEGDTIALRGSAMAAAAAGIGDHFARLVSQGKLHSATFEADRGCVGVFPITSTLLLIVTSQPTVTLGRFSAAAKKVLAILQSPQS
ncbi:roadblock/LC7 domain-containing protein [Nocardia sp. R6R-6]|uniref:roadblock/LC7 domain-containing protein n=1 Tax=Nocardia sp. R6R-6 TaxID=3459303 RepID=UPI00403DB104